MITDSANYQTLEPIQVGGFYNYLRRVPTALFRGVTIFINGLKPVATKCFEPTALVNTGM